MEIPMLHTHNILTFFLLFLVIYLFAYYAVFRNWGSKFRLEASSCFTSLAHGTPVVFMATYAIKFAQTQTPMTFASPNTTFQNTVLEFSTAYFLIDLLHYVLFFPNDILFILHHLATLYVILTCRYMVHFGAFEILFLIILAEATSACQNTWSLAGFRKSDVPAAAKLYEFLSLPFFAFYTVVRGIIGPFFVYKMGAYYLSGAAHNLIPGWVWVSWMVVIVSAILVSILWVFNHWIDWFTERSHSATKKVR